MLSKAILFLTLAFPFGSFAATPALRSGDLIFQTSWSSQADAIIMATGSPYSHVGVVEMKGSEAYVVEAIKKVSRTPLASWISRGRGGQYSVFRYRGLNSKQENRIVNAAKSYIGRKYDPFFTFTNEQIYCSELVWLAFRNVGLEVGRKQRIRELRIDNASVERLVQDRWRAHPLCRGLSNFRQCWNVLLDDQLVTPVSQADDTRLERVFSNYR